MPIVTVQLGQCGNQLGEAFFNTVYRDAYRPLTLAQSRSGKIVESEASYRFASTERFFDEHEVGRSGETHLYARSVLVDMEQKVVNSVLKQGNHASAVHNGKKNTWQFDPSSTFVQRVGSGNNWALGYFEHGDKSAGRVLGLIRREAERCDTLDGVHLLMSLAGGTGSGFGTYLTESVRDAFPHATIVDTVILPFERGEVVAQNYNATLSLAHLAAPTDTSGCDALILIENEQIASICNRLFLLQGGSSQSSRCTNNVDFALLNRVISEKLACALQPFLESDSAANDQHTLQRITSSLCCDNDYKLLSLRSCPHVSERLADFSRFNWQQLVRYARQMLIADGCCEEGIRWGVQPNAPNAVRSVANMLILRGGFDSSSTQPRTDAADTFKICKLKVNHRSSLLSDAERAEVDTFGDARLYGRRGVQVKEDVSDRFDCAFQPRSILHYDRLVALLSNSQSVCSPVKTIVRKASSMFAAAGSPYAFQFTKHGVDRQHFLDAFATIEQVVANYERLS